MPVLVAAGGDVVVPGLCFAALLPGPGELAGGVEACEELNLELMLLIQLARLLPGPPPSFSAELRLRRLGRFCCDFGVVFSPLPLLELLGFSLFSAVGVLGELPLVSGWESLGGVVVACAGKGKVFSPSGDFEAFGVGLPMPLVFWLDDLACLEWPLW